MCDYSLCGLPTRLAQEGEELVVLRFSTGSVGLASPAELSRYRTIEAHRTFWQRVKSYFDPPARGPAMTAVCIPPGARLLMKDIPKDLQCRWDVPESQNVVFFQTNAEVNAYRDAIQFPNGEHLLLQELREGLRIRVVSLSGCTFVEEPELAMHFR